MSEYIHELPAWPEFRWNRDHLAEPLANIRYMQGRLVGHMEALGFELRQEALLETITEDVVQTSAIEGERLDLRQVRSSVARRLGLDIAGLTASDRNVDGVVEMMLDATSNYDQPLTANRLFEWHSALFPTARSGLTRILTGAWREDLAGPMQVVSGAIGRERVHYEAPPAKRVPKDMKSFFRWFEGTSGTDAVLRAAQAHLWFVTIHPFEDGNGRIGRAIADMALARSESSPQRFYSMSSQIHRERTDYYDSLQRAQKGSLEITPWMEWFLACLGRAIEGAHRNLKSVLGKARFWEMAALHPLNTRQRTVLNRVLNGFEGRLTSSKWAILAKCSADTALRDISELLSWGLLERGSERGRSTGYVLPDLARAVPARAYATR